MGTYFVQITMNNENEKDSRNAQRKYIIQHLFGCTNATTNTNNSHFIRPEA
jgi:hypothetical protein